MRRRASEHRRVSRLLRSRAGAALLGVAILSPGCSSLEWRWPWSDASKAESSAESRELASTEGKHTIDTYFTGNDTFTRFDLREVLGPLLVDLRQAPLDESGVDDAIYDLKRFYADRGFPDARVRAAWKRTGELTWEIRFGILEGRRTFVADVAFEGVDSLALDQLAGCFPWERGAVAGTFARHVFGVGGDLLGIGEKVYSPAAMESGVACIRALYRLEGFQFVEVEAEAWEGPLGSVHVVVGVEEGPRFRLSQPVVLEGVESFARTEVVATFGLSDQTTFVPRLTMVLKGKVLEFYRSRGFPFVEVETHESFDRESGTATVTLDVEEGPHARIREIRLTGNEWTWDRVIRRYVRIEEGDVYDESLLRESSNDLLRAGLFESVAIERVPVEGDPHALDLVIELKEKVRYRITALAGYGSWELLRGALVFENTNVLGSGHRFRLQGDGSFRHWGTGGEYLIPYFFLPDLSQSTSAKLERREHPSFVERKVDTDAGFGYRFTDQLRGRLFHVFKDSVVEERSGLLPPELEEDVFVSSFNVAAFYDGRAGLHDPESGSSHRLRLEYAGDSIGSDLNFLRPTFATTWYVPLISSWRWKLAFSFRTGVIVPLADTEVIPIQERFFAGGDGSIRSFEQDEAGPRFNGEPIGGEAFLTWNFELRFPMEPAPVLEGLAGAVFADVGTVNVDVEDYGGGRYFFGVGWGVRYSTPVGPLRFDMGFNPDRASGEDLFVIHFALGFPF